MPNDSVIHPKEYGFVSFAATIKLPAKMIEKYV
jgi:hypothetical protein